MNSADNQASVSVVADVLGSVRKKGVRLWSENGQLHYRAPKGALTQEEVDRLRGSRGQIVAFLEAAADSATAESSLKPRSRLNRAPLAYSQLSHWHLHRLSERPAVRQIASAMRLRGRLSVDALQKSIAQIVRRHESLRTRIVVCDGVPAQEIVESVDCELVVDELIGMSEPLREVETQRRIEQLILEPIDVSVGPLFGVRLLKLADDEHVLIVAMEHIISDGYSLGILTQDLFTGYIQALKGRAVSLPTIPVQFADYAIWQRNTHRAWIEDHGVYWDARLAGCQRVRFPVDRSVGTPAPAGWGTIPVKIDKDLKKELGEWCRLRQTTLVMSVFTAYVGLALRWCDASDAVIQYITDGRVSPKIENTIGYFASTLYLRVELSDADSFIDLTSLVMNEYCRAYEHADFSFMEAQVPRPGFTRNTSFNWIPQRTQFDLPDLVGSEDAIACSPLSFGYPVLKKLDVDHEPVILLHDCEDEIVGVMGFPLNRFSVDTMTTFGRNFVGFVEALVRQPEARVKDILLRSQRPSDLA
jgi:hypothetical protein